MDRGKGTDLCNEGVVCAIPWTLIDGLPLPQGSQGPLLILEHLESLLKFRAGNSLLCQLLPQGLWKEEE